MQIESLNFIELIILVLSAFLLRKRFDDFLFWLMPNTWVPLYNSVSFTHMPYKKCVDNRKWQDEFLNKTMKLGAAAFVGLTGFGVFYLMKNQDLNNFNLKIDFSRFMKL